MTLNKIYFGCMYAIFSLLYSRAIFSLPEVIYRGCSTLIVLVFLTVTLIQCRGFMLWVSILSLIVGHIVFFAYDLGFLVWHDGITKTMALPALFTVIPMISFPLMHGGYLEAVAGFIRHHRRKPFIVFSILGLLHLVLAIPLNIGSILTLNKLIEKARIPTRVLGMIYTAGYSSYMVFSPYDAMMNLVLLWTGISYADYFVGGLAMVITIFLISNLYLIFERQKMNISLAVNEEDGADFQPAKIYELVAHVFALILLAMASVFIFPFKNPIFGVGIVIIIYSLFWARLAGVWEQFLGEFQNYGQNLLNYRNFLPFLVATGFLGTLTAYTPIKNEIEQFLLLFQNLPVYFIIQGFILLTMVLSICGVHMMISITTYALTVSPEIIGISAPAFSLMLLTCWYCAMAISPFAPFAAIVGETIGATAFTVSLKQNLRFSVTALFISPLVIIAIDVLSR